MKKVISLIAVFFALAVGVSAQTETKGSVMTVHVSDIDTAKTDDTTVLGYVFLQEYKIKSNKGEFEMTAYLPTMEDVREAERLLLKKYWSIMPGKEDRWGKVTRPRLKSYVRQYIFGVTADGKRYVWVNAVSKEQTDLMDEMKERTIHVRDGGNYFWNTLFNLDDGTMVFCMVNGEA